MKIKIDKSDIHAYDVFFTNTHREVYIVVSNDMQDVSYICFKQTTGFFHLNSIAIDGFVYFVNKYCKEACDV